MIFTVLSLKDITTKLISKDETQPEFIICLRTSPVLENKLSASSQYWLMLYDQTREQVTQLNFW